ncbi:MAG: amidohydrolase family protein [Rhodopirellula sp.]|nr:amidohydrolase family protein [Rhodopirellula sp.]
MPEKNRLSRRSSLKGFGLLGATALLGCPAETVASAASLAPEPPTDARKQIFSRVRETTFIDTHEHLCEERDRLGGDGPDDWSLVLAGYLGSDLVAAGMPRDSFGKFYSKGPSPSEKWKLLEPYWPAVKNTGYGQAARISIRELYGVDDLSAATVEQVQAGYEGLRRPGFYRHVLCEIGKIESCQVNSSNPPFIESAQPTLLMQDISIVGMFAGPNLKAFGDPTGRNVSSLADWHGVIDWWFAKYGQYAVAAKSQDAYRRNIDYEPTPAETAEPVFKKKLEQQSVSADEQKALEDHLFWYAVSKATENRLPVKLHTGYYAGDNRMPLARLLHNAGSACDLCRAAPETPFLFMHICYPYYEELISVAKQYTNACVDMCWAWIINPLAAKDFLKKYLVTAPANKIVTFGGDYRNVEQVVGHALIARQGIALALSELVEEGWLSIDDALALVDPIMHGNARRIFRLKEKEKAIEGAPWA